MSEQDTKTDLPDSRETRQVSSCSIPDEPFPVDEAMVRFRRREAWARTPQQRMDVARALQKAAWDLLRSRPQAMREFVRRNHHKRRITEVERLERELRGLTDE